MLGPRRGIKTSDHCPTPPHNHTRQRWRLFVHSRLFTMSFLSVKSIMWLLSQPPFISLHLAGILFFSVVAPFVSGNISSLPAVFFSFFGTVRGASNLPWPLTLHPQYSSHPFVWHFLPLSTLILSLRIVPPPSLINAWLTPLVFLWYLSPSPVTLYHTCLSPSPSYIAFLRKKKWEPHAKRPQTHTLLSSDSLYIVKCLVKLS